MKTTKTVSLTSKAFLPRAKKAPKKWTYVAEVPTDSRIEWKANLLARNGIRKPVREGLLRKVRPGTYAITTAGRKAL
jgi:hypothetical protein